MENYIGSRITKKVWNLFRSRDPTWESKQNIGPSSSHRPHQQLFSSTTERTILNTAITKIAVDVAMMDYKHVIVDGDGFYKEDVSDNLNDCLTVEANIDQTHRAFILDYAISLMDEGVVALVPIDYDDEPTAAGAFDVISMRVGRIVEWKPAHVRVEVYNDRSGFYQQILVPKATTAIIENPFYNVMNAHNSVMRRLNRKLALLDAVDEISSSGKLDLIIQLPYVVKSDYKRRQAKDRMQDLQDQLNGSSYGIAYIDGSEKVTQLNRPVDNNLLKQVEYLTSMLFGQLGITQGILDGSADDKTMTNYLMRIVQPIVQAFVDEAQRKFLTKKARTQGHRIMAFNDPFRLVPVSLLPDLVDKFGRNEILSPNEIRVKIGYKPSKDEKANELRNRNIAAPKEETSPKTPVIPKEEESQNG